jgi:SAM-dependent methyltransferase
MSDTDLSGSTDLAWEEWGRRDPYFGVLTDPKFRRRDMSDHTKREFFQLGQWHVQYVLDIIHRYLQPNFIPADVLDFGCGVGRTLVHFATLAERVVGLDVSQAMLQEARQNCDEQGRNNVRLLLSDDALSSLAGSFDLIHSCIVFQHIPIERGRTIFSRLLAFMRPGGIGAIQLTYAKSRFADTYGVEPPPAPEPIQPAKKSKKRTAPVADIVATSSLSADPEMQMNPYNLSEILFCLQRFGVQRFHAEFTDHGGELGVFLFFQKPIDCSSTESS